MAKILNLILSPKQVADSEVWLSIATRKLGVQRSQVALARVIKRSVDARSFTPKVNLTVELFIDNEPLPEEIHFDYPNVNGKSEVIIVGGGPAGLFAALRLIELGLCPIILERGKDVSERRLDIAQIHRGGDVNPESNYAFGEGGAGAFSDGKLFTRSKKRGDYNKALQTLVFHGASPEILYEAHPHIGTDKLPKVIENMRKTIIECGGKVLFGKKVTDFIIKDSIIKGVCCGDERIEAQSVILATGHSATDIYEMLHKNEVRLEAKPFAMGVRIEHWQETIDRIQYHSLDFREWLPPATYQLVTKAGGRGVYSFCMCPGGIIVPAMTSDKECVVNGMSSSARGSQWANSAIVTEVYLDDFEHLKEKWGELAGLKYRQNLEHLAREHGADKQMAPAQRMTDFFVGKKSKTLPPTSYTPSLVISQMDKWLPKYMVTSLRGGFRSFEGKMKGFLTPEANIIGVESRTSTPVRIPRDPETLQHPEIKGLFPTGEGAGYAGGIISAALDGERVASAVLNSIS